MKAWQIDLSKYARNAGDTERSSVYLGKVTRNKDGLQFNGNYFVDGAILTNRDFFTFASSILDKYIRND